MPPLHTKPSKPLGPASGTTFRNAGKWLPPARGRGASLALDRVGRGPDPGFFAMNYLSENLCDGPL